MFCDVRFNEWDIGICGTVPYPIIDRQSKECFVCRARHARRTTTCCGTTTTSGRTSCSAWRTSFATRTCAVRARCPSPRPPTTRTSWPSERATTSLRKSTTRAKARTSPAAARTARPSPWRALSPCTPSPRRSCISPERASLAALRPPARPGSCGPDGSVPTYRKLLNVPLSNLKIEKKKIAMIYFNFRQLLEFLS